MNVLSTQILVATARTSPELMRALAHCHPGEEDAIIDAGFSRALPGGKRRQWRFVAPGLRKDARLAAQAVCELLSGFDGTPESLGSETMAQVRSDLLECIGASWRRLVVSAAKTKWQVSHSHRCTLEGLGTLEAGPEHPSAPHLNITIEVVRAVRRLDAPLFRTHTQGPGTLSDDDTQALGTRSDDELELVRELLLAEGSNFFRWGSTWGREVSVPSVEEEQMRRARREISRQMSSTLAEVEAISIPVPARRAAV